MKKERKKENYQDNYKASHRVKKIYLLKIQSTKGLYPEYKKKFKKKSTQNNG